MINFQNPQFLRSGWTAKGIHDNARIAVFAGRSNAGKSSVINALCGGKFARAAKTPGRTRMINLFQLHGGHILADLPGYGFANVPLQQRILWDNKINNFLKEPKIVAAVLVTDSRRGIGKRDISLLNLLSNLHILVLLNKADKLNFSQLNQQIKHDQLLLNKIAPHAQILPFSASHKTGLLQAREAASRMLSHDSPRPSQ